MEESGLPPLSGAERRMRFGAMRGSLQGETFSAGDEQQRNISNNRGAMRARFALSRQASFDVGGGATEASEPSPSNSIVSRSTLLQ